MDPNAERSRMRAVATLVLDDSQTAEWDVYEWSFTATELATIYLRLDAWIAGGGSSSPDESADGDRHTR